PNERYASVADFRQALAEACRPIRSRSLLRSVGILAVLAALALAIIVPFVSRRSAEPPPDPERPDRLWALHDNPDDLSLLDAEDGGELASGSAPVVERIRVENPQGKVPPELPLSHWPALRPVLVVHSPRAWGFVQPLTDRTLSRRVVERWP